MKDIFEYGKWTNEAFLLIFKKALNALSETRDRAIYITFLTKYIGVTVPESIREKFPDKITIVLENEFWDVEILPKSFRVTLIFDQDQSRIEIPFKSIVSFSDKRSKVCFEFNHDTDKEEDETNIINIDKYRN